MKYKIFKTKVKSNKYKYILVINNKMITVKLMIIIIKNYNKLLIKFFLI